MEKPALVESAKSYKRNKHRLCFATYAARRHVDETEICSLPKRTVRGQSGTQAAE